MAKALYVQRGEAIDYKNIGSADIEANEIVVLEGRIGIAGCAIPIGRIGSLHVLGVFSLPANPSEVFAAGQSVGWDGEKIVASATEGATAAGWAVEPKASGTGFVSVKIG